MLKKSATAFAAAMTMSMIAASGAHSMGLGSLSRQHPVFKSDEIVTNSVPGDRSMRSFQPKFRLILLSIGSFLRQQQSALAQNGAATVQLITFSAR